MLTKILNFVINNIYLYEHYFVLRQQEQKTDINSIYTDLKLKTYNYKQTKLNCRSDEVTYDNI